MIGARQGKELILESLRNRGTTTLLRGIRTPLTDGRLRQHFLESRDGGKTWEEWFDGYSSAGLSLRTRRKRAKRGRPLAVRPWNAYVTSVPMAGG